MTENCQRCTRGRCACPRGDQRSALKRRECPAHETLCTTKRGHDQETNAPEKATLQTMITFTAVFQEAAEGGYIAFVAELPGANTQGETIEEARENLHEAVVLVLD